MNLKIADNSFRFRITPVDLGNLLRGQDVDQRVCIGKHCFTYRISPVSQDGEIKLEMAVAGFCLSVPREKLEELRALGRSKDGLSIVQDGVDVSLQVDVRQQKKSKPDHMPEERQAS